MKHVLIIYTLIFLALSCQTQTEKTEKDIGNIDSTIMVLNEEKIIEPDVIPPEGSQILYKSRSAYYVGELAGLWLTNVSITDCENDEKEPNGSKHNQMSAIIQTDTTLSIEFYIFETCASDFLFDVKVVNQNTLDLIYFQYNSWADCRCCYGIKYDFVRSNDTLDYYDLKYHTFNGENKIPFSFNK
jgi:hypothetical protein